MSLTRPRQYYVDVNLNHNQLLQAALENSATPPLSPVPGQVYYDTTTQLIYFFDGLEWKTFSSPLNLLYGDGIDIIQDANDNYIVSVRANTSQFRFDYGVLTLKDGGVTTSLLANYAVTLSKIQQIPSQSVLGRTTAGTGNVEVISLIGDLAQGSSFNLPTSQAVLDYLTTTLGNYVTLNTVQTITAKKTFTADVDIRNALNVYTTPGDTLPIVQVRAVTDGVANESRRVSFILKDTPYFPAFAFRSAYGFSRFDLYGSYDGGTYNVGHQMYIWTDNPTDPSTNEAGALNWTFQSGNLPTTNRPLFTINNGQGGGIFNTSIFKIFSNGDIALNQNADAGYRFDVNGTTRIQQELTLSKYGTGAVTSTAAYFLGVTSSGQVIEIADPTGGISLPTFSSGLTNTSGVVKLGGTLTQNTTINGDVYNLTIRGDGDITLRRGLASADNAYLAFYGTNYFALGTQAFNQYFTYDAFIDSAGTNSYAEIYGGNTTTGDSRGVGITSTKAFVYGNYSLSLGMTIDILGKVKLTPYGSGTFTGTPTYLLATDVNGNVIEVNGSGFLGITSTNVSNWNTAYSWGNHALAGYVTSSGLTGYVTLATNQTITGVKTFNPTVSAAAYLAKGVMVTSALTATANTDVLAALDIAPTFTTGAYTYVYSYGIRTSADILLTQANAVISGNMLTSGTGGVGNNLTIRAGGSTGFGGGHAGGKLVLSAGNSFSSSGGTDFAGNIEIRAGYNMQSINLNPGHILFYIRNAEAARFVNTSSNFLIGTSTDSGYKLDVNGTVRFTSSVTAGGAAAFAIDALGNTVSIGNTPRLIMTSYTPTMIKMSGSGLFGIGPVGRIDNQAVDVGLGRPSGGLLEINDGITLGNYRDLSSRSYTSAGTITAASALARAVNISNTLTAAANNDVLVGLDINPVFTNGAFTGVSNYGLRIQGNTTRAIDVISTGTTAEISVRSTSTSGFAAMNFYNSSNTIVGGFGYGNSGVSAAYANKFYFANSNSVPFGFVMNSTEVFRFFNNGNILIQQGGTFTDAGYKLDVNGTTRLQGNTTINVTSSLLKTDSSGIIAAAVAGTDYLSTLPTASASVLGAIKVGVGLTIDGSGVLSLIDPTNPIRYETSYIATASQTTFTITSGYTPGLVDIYLNGSKLSGSAYTATNGTTVVLADPCVSGDIISVVAYIMTTGTAFAVGTAVSIGTTTTGAAGSSASVTNVGTSTAPILNFTIPRGADGVSGTSGTSATISVGTTTTGAAGSSAVVTNSGTTSAAVLDFTIPKGDQGDPGPAGADGNKSNLLFYYYNNF